MTQHEMYLKVLRDSKDKNTDIFFKWLKKYPDFMTFTEIEIEINFMLYSMVVDAYKLGAKND